MLDGRVPHVLLLELFTAAGIGTMITGSPSSGDEITGSPSSGDEITGSPSSGDEITGVGGTT
jgi:hypothetical protein